MLRRTWAGSTLQGTTVWVAEQMTAPFFIAGCVVQFQPEQQAGGGRRCTSRHSSVACYTATARITARRRSGLCVLQALQGPAASLHLPQCSTAPHQNRSHQTAHSACSRPAAARSPSCRCCQDLTALTAASNTFFPSPI